MPSNPLDAYGLLLSAIVDPNPVMVLLPKALLRVRGKALLPGEPDDPDLLHQMIDAPVGDRRDWQPHWPDLQPYFVPLGQAALIREGRNATVISQGRTLPLCVRAADQLRQEHGLTFDVIDLRSLFPYDWPALSASVRRTGRVLIVNEDTEVSNFAEHVLRRIVEEHFDALQGQPRVLLGKHVPGIGLNPVYEQNTVPQMSHILEAMHALGVGPVAADLQVCRVLADLEVRRHGTHALWSFLCRNWAREFTRPNWSPGWSRWETPSSAARVSWKC